MGITSMEAEISAPLIIPSYGALLEVRGKIFGNVNRTRGRSIFGYLQFVEDASISDGVQLELNRGFIGR
jgi:hypothetical protein